MPFHVSCPTCESRLKLPDRLYQTRVRGRLAALHCTRCKKEFQIDGRSEPQGNKLPSVPPAADSPALEPSATTPAVPSAAAPGTQAAPSDEPPAAEAILQEGERFPSAPALESSQSAARHAPLRDPSPAELKSLFSSEDGWDQPPAAAAAANAPRSARPTPVARPAVAAPAAAPKRPRETATLASRLDDEARARAQRAAFRASRPPKPARPRAAATRVPAAAALGSTESPSATPDGAHSQHDAPSAKPPEPPTLRDLPRVSPAVLPAEKQLAVPAVPPVPVPVPEASPASQAHTDLSAMLPSEPPRAVSPAAANVAAPDLRTWRVPGRALAIASGVGLLACAVWLATRTPDPAPEPLLAGAATRAQPALALIRSRLQTVRDDAASSARLAAEQRAREAEAATATRAPKKRRRTRRAHSRAQTLATQRARASSDDRSSSRQPRNNASTANQSTKARPFDIKSANRALNAAAARARFCGQGSALQQPVVATVTFDPSGRARVVRVSRTRAGACVAGKLRAARVPSFQGNPVTVSRRIVVSGSGRASR